MQRKSEKKQAIRDKKSYQNILHLSSDVVIRKRTGWFSFIPLFSISKYNWFVTVYNKNVVSVYQNEFLFAYIHTEAAEYLLFKLYFTKKQNEKKRRRWEREWMYTDIQAMFRATRFTAKPATGVTGARRLPNLAANHNPTDNPSAAAAVSHSIPPGPLPRCFNGLNLVDLPLFSNVVR